MSPTTTQIDKNKAKILRAVVEILRNDIFPDCSVAPLNQTHIKIVEPISELIIASLKTEIISLLILNASNLSVTVISFAAILHSLGVDNHALRTVFKGFFVCSAVDFQNFEA